MYVHDTILLKYIYVTVCLRICISETRSHGMIITYSDIGGYADYVSILEASSRLKKALIRTMTLLYYLTSIG